MTGSIRHKGRHDRLQERADARSVSLFSLVDAPAVEGNGGTYRRSPKFRDQEPPFALALDSLASLIDHMKRLAREDATMNVGDWLRKLGLERYEPAFRENRVTSEILPKLTAEDLRDLGVVLVGDRRLLLDAIGSLRSEGGVRSANLPDVVDRPSDGGRPAATERRQLTVMFCDLVDSTALSGRLDPEDYREVIKSFQIAVSDAARKFDGHVAKYLGDGVLIYFGYPQAHEDDADRAVRSGLVALEAVHRLAPQEGNSRLEARIGIATGVVVAGDVAEGGVSEAGAISGETPNLAARLQGLASPGEVVISESTHRLVEGIFDRHYTQNKGAHQNPLDTVCCRIFDGHG
jgi:class 3 adenylate cyclase